MVTEARRRLYALAREPSEAAAGALPLHMCFTATDPSHKTQKLYVWGRIVRTLLHLDRCDGGEGGKGTGGRGRLGRGEGCGAGQMGAGEGKKEERTTGMSNGGRR